MASVTSAAAVAAAAFYGGWEWALLSILVLITLWRVDFQFVAILTTMGGSYFWLALFYWTGDRRLFFPYALQFAVQMRYLLDGRTAKPAIVGGGGIIAVFLLIRVAQSATASVLIVELLIATGILVVVVKAGALTSRGARARVIAGVIGSTLAFAGLAI